MSVNSCPRTRADGTPCKAPPMIGYPACWPHLDRAERDQAARAKEADRQKWTLQAADRQAAGPFCWSLPMPAVPLVTDNLPAALDDWQGERCALCGHSIRRGSHLDHCHVTGLIRGLLCRSCNTREGLSGAQTFALYRGRPPAVILGWAEPYYDLIGHQFAAAAPWVVQQLGPVPSDPPAAARYLETAATIDDLRDPWDDNALDGVL